jgi:hypothetical protein
MARINEILFKILTLVHAKKMMMQLSIKNQLLLNLQERELRMTSNLLNRIGLVKQEDIRAFKKIE